MQFMQRQMLGLVLDLQGRDIQPDPRLEVLEEVHIGTKKEAIQKKFMKMLKIKFISMTRQDPALKRWQAGIHYKQRFCVCH